MKIRRSEEERRNAGTANCAAPSTRAHALIQGLTPYSSSSAGAGELRSTVEGEKALPSRDTARLAATARVFIVAGAVIVARGNETNLHRKHRRHRYEHEPRIFFR